MVRHTLKKIFQKNILIYLDSLICGRNHTHSSTPVGALNIGYPHLLYLHRPCVNDRCNSANWNFDTISPNDFGNKL